MVFKKKPANTSATKTSSSQKQLISSDTKTYSSNQFRLDFKYPSDWTVNEDSGSGLLTATSPKINLPAANGSTAGQVVFKIRANSQNLPEFDAGNATSAADSEKIAYDNPSSAQRGQTYVSFLNFASSANNNLIDGIYITGDFGYLKGQDIPKGDIKKLDPIISISFNSCDGTCSGAAAIPVEAWTSPDFGVPLRKFLQTLVIQ